MEERRPRVLAIDAGGTMTDTFIVDELGSFVVGKAQTTPDDESVGFMESARDALKQWESSPEEAFGTIASGIYSGTAMLNRLLSRQGLEIGAIVTAGQEDYLKIERGIQTYLGYSYSDRLHLATHYHNPSLVPRERMKGVRGRIDVFGEEVAPLREQDAREAAAELLDAGVDGICVCLLLSYRNAEHEIRVGEILAEEKAKRGVDGQVPVFLSSELYPQRRDLPRLNSTLIEAYAAEPSRGTLKAVRDQTKKAGARFELRVMASHGGTISIEARELARTLVSGPIGGVVGGQGIAERLGIPNALCTDIGGTSFDIALITDGRFEITPTPDIARFMLNMPLVKIDSIGAGTGSFVRVNPNSGRPELGPDSAGARIGVCWPEGGLETISVTDLNLVLGRVNPDYFLGGDVKLDPERARAEVERQLAEPLGLELDDAAAGVVGLFEQTLKNEAVGRILGKGYSPADYALLCYGGGGPLHVGGYTEGVAYRDVLVPAWAAGFSAYGCACADFEYRYDQTIDMPILPGQDELEKAGIAVMITGGWLGLEDKVADEFAKSGIERDAITFTHAVRMQYYGQLNDIEIVSPHAELEDDGQLDDLIDEFERAYGKVYARSARSPELGYLVTQAIVHGSVEVEKPALPDFGEGEGAPPSKGARRVRWGDDYADSDIYELDQVEAGNSITGPAIVEATRDLEPREREPIGWEGKRLDQMLAESERLFADTGSYCGLSGELELKDSDPIGYEKLFARLRGGLVSARETALNISASPIVRELGELCFALYTPEGDSVALSTGIIVHVHTMSDAIKWMVRHGYEDNPGIRPGDIFANNDPVIGDVHNADGAASPTCSTSAPRRPEECRWGRPTGSTTASTCPA
ncbi:MAG: hydantoinase/oxoprolinase family protein [Actinobacteria bacterium]|nr:MAG: hydantoinase/oxoprolinase family protein [Actinomycetota bacterium]